MKEKLVVFLFLMVLALWITVSALVVPAYGSFQGNEKQVLGAHEPAGCETDMAYLDDASAKVAKLGDGLVIVVARLGDGESSRSLNRRRLAKVRQYLSEEKGLKERVIVAEGEHVKGYGRIEVYIEGKLLYVLPIRRNKPILSPCPG